jgi:hypothetical protein
MTSRPKLTLLKINARTNIVTFLMESSTTEMTLAPSQRARADEVRLGW